MNIKQLVSSACSLCALVALSACNNSPPTGTLVVPFEIGSGVACSGKNVQEVTVTLVDDVADDRTEAPAVTVDCDEGKAQFDAVDVGTYVVIAEGKDPNGKIVVDNGATVETNVAEVLEGQVVTLPGAIKMQTTPAKLWIRWTLDGFLDQCDKIPVANFEVIAYKNDGTDQLLMGAFACDSMPDTPDSYRILPDPDRDLDGADLDTIEIIPRDASGNPVGTKAYYALVNTPGPGTIVKLTFSSTCTAEKCDLACADPGCQPDPE
jgi:hypothetical protein